MRSSEKPKSHEKIFLTIDFQLSMLKVCQVTIYHFYHFFRFIAEASQVSISQFQVTIRAALRCLQLRPSLYGLLFWTFPWAYPTHPHLVHFWIMLWIIWWIIEVQITVNIVLYHLFFISYLFNCTTAAASMNPVKNKMINRGAEIGKYSSLLFLTMALWD